MPDLPNLRELILADGDIDLDAVGGSGVDPVTASRLWITSNGQAGLASSATFTVTWDLVQESVGADIAVNGVDPTLIDIVADGLYVVSFDATAQTDGGTWFSTDFSVYTIGAPSVAARKQRSANPETKLADQCGVAWFMPAGQQVQAYIDCETSGDETWTVTGSELHIQRVA